MKNILITFTNEVLMFSYDNLDDLYDTTSNNLKIFSCTPKDILEKKDELKKFIIKNVKKYKIKNIVISEFSLTKIAFMLTDNLYDFTTLYFKEKRELPSDIYKLLLKNNISVLRCFSVTKEMLNALENKGIEVILKNTSKFALENDLNEACFSKTNIIFDCPLTKNDFKGFNNIVKNTNCLSTIDIKNYSDEALANILNVLITNNKKGITINIYEHNEDIIKRIPKLKKLQKKYKKHFKFKIIYSKEYKEKYRKKQIILNVITFLLVCLIIGIIIFFLNAFLADKKSSNINKNIKKIKDEVQNETAIQNEEEEKEETAYNRKYSKIISELQKINDETVGWLTLNNTKIDYPVVKHRDNDFYLTHDFEKKSNMYGWVFMDYRNKTDVLDSNTIIYGHDSGSVTFGTLYRVLNKNWYTNKNNQIITFNTATDSGNWQIFSIYKINETSDYLKNTFQNNEEYTNFLNMIKKRSIYNFKTDVTASDKILTLSTCYGDKQRLIVHAKKLA